MNRKQMLQRLNEGHHPLMVSAEKWEDGEFLGGSINCACCEVWYYGCIRCHECPLAEYDSTDAFCCEGYSEWSRSRINSTQMVEKKARTNMLTYILLVAAAEGVLDEYSL